ncbi:putative FMO family protein [Lyophyllum shimeji]|uniref:FMO family protein n=1 Tax=Lyophyllum shimeji TaxID=47721 RepID=A0A9P3PV67_LYOSH|nr:putative FMO family protein [Lyophyllum shimeji]
MDLPTLQPESSSKEDFKTICIIGAGPSGLAALKVILDSPQYKAGKWKPTAFESRDSIGGVWLPAPPTDDPPLTPLYDSLTSNLPHPIMAFPSYPFPPSTPLFPRANLVLDYLSSYADHFHLRPHIKLNTTVASVVRSPASTSSSPTWHVSLSTGNTLNFDLVLVCNGHYRIPRYPNIPGLARWLNARRASHSAWYRHPTTNLGPTVLVVGAGPSGHDIARDMLTASHTSTVIHSGPAHANTDVGNLKLRGRVSHFGESGEVAFEDGTTEHGVSHAILATGYELSFPFLPPFIVRPGVPPPAPPLPKELYNSTYSLFPLARHLWPLHHCIPSSSMAFLGLLVRVAPFPVVEAQARAALYAFEDRERLDSTREAVEVVTRYEALRERVGSDDPTAIAKAWHRFEPLEQFDYRDALYDFVSSPRDGDLEAVWESRSVEGSSNGIGRGARVPEWEKEAYLAKDVLRKAWVRLEERGEAEEWVRGVGEGGLHEWVEMMRRLKTWAEEHWQEIDVVNEEVDKSRL